MQPFADDDVHHGERQRDIAARIDEEVLVAGRAGAIAVRVDGVELRAVAPRFHDERPEVDVGAEDVRAPGEDQLGVAELLGLGAVAHAERLRQSHAAGRGTDGAVEPRGAEAVEEAAVHAAAVEQAHGAGVAVGQDGFGAELVRDRAQAFGDGVERFVPGDALEASRALGAHAALRIEQPLRVIFALEILRHFAAEEAARYGVVRIAAQTGGMVVLHGDQERAAVRAIQRTHGMTDFGHFQRLYRGQEHGYRSIAITS